MSKDYLGDIIALFEKAKVNWSIQFDHSNKQYRVVVQTTPKDALTATDNNLCSALNGVIKQFRIEQSK